MIGIRAVIVDIGGVLLLRDVTAAHRAWEERLGIAPGGFARGLFRADLAAQATTGMVTAAEVWGEMAARFGLSEADVRQLRRDFFAAERLNEAFARFLRSLRPTYRITALSNAWSGTREAMCRFYGLDRFVDVMIFSDEERLAKPDPRIYALAVTRTGVPPAETLFVDDLPRNVEAARDVGMIGIHFRDTAQAIAEIARYLGEEGTHS